MSKLEIKVPDIGDFDQVPVIEILVSAGDQVQKDQSLITLESDKATLEVPAAHSGSVVYVHVEVGDEVSEGDVIVTLESDSDAPGSDEPGPDEEGSGDQKADEQDASLADDSGAVSHSDSDASSTADHSTADKQAQQYDCDVLVLGAGPGGYTAAFRAADLGLNVILIERFPRLGGVCLNVGCIPSKALLHTGKVIDEAAAMAEHGVSFAEPSIDLDKLRSWKDSVVERLTKGLDGLAKKRKVRVITGQGKFEDDHHISIRSQSGHQQLSFANCIIAAGSEAIQLPNLPWDDERVMDSTDALKLQDIPATLLIIGGGIIGLEMACIHAALGSQVTVVELADELMPGADHDLVKPLQQQLQQRGVSFHLRTKVTTAKATEAYLQVEFEGDNIPETKQFERILAAVGRVPNGHQIAAENAGVQVDKRGFINADKQQRTNISHIYAIGDIIGQPMLAHKASHEGKVAAEVCAGENAWFDAKVIPSVAYTDPEVAWVGVTELQAKAEQLDVEITRFPWSASGRSLGMGRSEGLTKLIFDKSSKRIIGAGVVGPQAGDLIAECVLAIEMGADAEDIGLAIHPHPTLSETVAMAAEAMSGTLTDLYMPKKRPQ